MQKYFFALLFSLMAFHALAQDIPLSEAVDDTWRNQELKEGKAFISPKAIAGTPYLEKTFKEGKLVGTEGMKFPPVPLRYNVYTDNIEYKANNGKIYALQGHNKIKAYQIGDTTFVYLPFFEKKDKISSGFFRELVPGHVNGLVRYNVFLLPAVPEKPYQKAKPERFSQITKTFYVRIGNAPAHAVNRTKEFLNLFPQQKKQLGQFVKKKKIHIQKEADFDELVRFCQTLFPKLIKNKI